jgi:Domain of unknown function (DUF4399)
VTSLFSHSTKPCLALRTLLKIIMTTSFKSSFSRRLAVASFSAAMLVISGCASMGEPAQAARILEPADGATVGTTFMVKFGIKGMKVEPAGDVVANSGHHHLLINLDPIAAGESIPFTEKHMHFGKGQTEGEVKLAPGTYTLTAQFANGAHQSYGKAMSHSIKVTVK